MFIAFAETLSDFHWQWHYLAVLCMGTVACGSQFPNVRRMALEQGLIPMMSYGDIPKPNDDSSCDWMIRAACTVVLKEIYQQFRSMPSGLLAREVMANRKLTEEHPTVLNLLNDPKAKVPQAAFTRRSSFLFKYIAISCAEIHSEIQNDYHYMRKFIQTAEQDKKKKMTTRTRTKTKKTLGAHIGKKDEINTKTQDFKLVQTPEPDVLSTRHDRKGEFKNLEKVSFSNQPYHYNYRKVPYLPDETEELYSTFKPKDPVHKSSLPLIQPSFITSTSAGAGFQSMHLQEVGTMNRRKLFNAENAIPENPIKEHRSEHKIPIKMPIVPQMAVGKIE